MAANLSITDHPPILDNIFRAAPETPPRTVSVWLVAAVILAAVAALWWLGLPWWAATPPDLGRPGDRVCRAAAVGGVRGEEAARDGE